MDVSLWLERRKFDNQEPLREEHGFVIINNELEKELDDFKSEFIKGSIWIPEHDLLWHWYNVNNDCPDVVKKFGGTYFRLTQQTLDTFFTWMTDTKEQASRIYENVTDNCLDAEATESTGECVKKSKLEPYQKLPDKLDSDGKSVTSCTVDGASKIKQNNTNRKRRCMQCEGCKANDCGSCFYCKDKRKFGGPGKKKQACVKRQCMQIEQCPGQDVQSASSSPLRFLSLFDRHLFPVLGDGNCLFRCFSYAVYGTEEQHYKIRLLLVDFMLLNSSLFTAACHPATVEDHTIQMRHNYVWGTHAEILAFAAFFQVPVYTVVEKADDTNYWAKYAEQSEELIVYQSTAQYERAAISLQFKHLELFNIKTLTMI